MTLVYRHRRLDNNQIFYVGISENKKRANNKTKRSDWWKKIVKKTNYKVEIIYENLTREDACELEIFLISLYGRRNLRTGCLVNVTDGGDAGTVGRKATDEQIKKMSILRKGIKLSDETKKRMSETHKALGTKPIITEESLKKKSDSMKGKSSFMKGKKHSEETKIKISNAKRGVESKKKKKVVQINPFNNETVKIFNSYTEAYQETKINNIVRCIKGLRKTAGNYKWKYYE